MFFVGVEIFFYAQISWLFLVVLTVLMAWVLTPAKNLGDDRSHEKVESACKIITTNIAIYWLSIADCFSLD